MQQCNYQFLSSFHTLSSLTTVHFSVLTRSGHERRGEAVIDLSLLKVDALGDTVTPVVSAHQASSAAVTAESLSPDTKLILEEVSRYLNLEKLLPSYKVVRRD